MQNNEIASLLYSSFDHLFLTNKKGKGDSAVLMLKTQSKLGKTEDVVFTDSHTCLFISVASSALNGCITDYGW